MAATTANTLLFDHHHPHHSPIHDVVNIVYEKDQEDDDFDHQQWAPRDATTAKTATTSTSRRASRSSRHRQTGVAQDDDGPRHCVPPSEDSAGIRSIAGENDSGSKRGKAADCHNFHNQEEILVMRRGTASMDRRHGSNGEEEEEEGSTHFLVEPLLSPSQSQGALSSTGDDAEEAVGLNNGEERHESSSNDDNDDAENWFLECCQTCFGSWCTNLLLLLTNDVKRIHLLNLSSYLLNLTVQIVFVILSSKEVVLRVQEVYSNNPTLLTPARWTYLVMWMFVTMTDGMFAVSQLLVSSYRQRQTEQQTFFVHLQLGRILWTICFSLQWLIPATLCVLYILTASVMAVMMTSQEGQRQHDNDDDGGGNRESVVDGVVEGITSSHRGTQEGTVDFLAEDEEDMVVVVVSQQSRRRSRFLDYCVLQFPFELHFGWAAVVLAVHCCMVLTSMFHCGDGIHLAWAIASLSILFLVAVVFLFGRGTELCLCFWGRWSPGDNGETWTRNSLLPPTSNLIVPAVIVWSFIGIGWELHSQLASSERGSIFVEMTTDLGMVVTTGVSCASYMFAALIGVLWVPKFVHQITQDYLTIGVVEH